MTREAMEYDVVIVGAGPSGLAAAIRLKPQAEKADKLAAFNRALAESDDEPATGAFSSRKKKAEEAEEADGCPFTGSNGLSMKVAEACSEAPPV